MTLALVIVAVALVALTALAVRRQNRLDRHWRAERERLESYGERLAVRNGHPHTGDVIAISETRDRDQTP